MGTSGDQKYVFLGEFDDGRLCLWSLLTFLSRELLLWSSFDSKNRMCSLDTCFSQIASVGRLNEVVVQPGKTGNHQAIQHNTTGSTAPPGLPPASPTPQTGLKIPIDLSTATTEAIHTSAKP